MHSFETLASQGGFVESANFGGNFYGTSVQAVKSVAEKGLICVLDIEMEGVRQIKKTDLNARVCFLQPPSVGELERRLRSRGTEKEEAVQKRLKQAENEMRYCREEGRGDMVVVNDDLETAYKELEEWVVDGGRYGSDEKA